MARKFNHNGTEIPIRITYKQAMFDFKDMGLNLLALFKDQEVLMTIMSNDEVMLKVWFSYVKDYTGSFEKALEDLSPETMHHFKEVFWEEVLNFIAPPMRPIAVEMKKEIMDALASPRESLKEASSRS